MIQKKDEKREVGCGVQAEKMKSKERVKEMSQGAGYRAGKGTDVWEQKNLCRKSGHRLGVKIKFSLRDLKGNREK